MLIANSVQTTNNSKRDSQQLPATPQQHHKIPHVESTGPASKQIRSNTKESLQYFHIFQLFLTSREVQVACQLQCPLNQRQNSTTKTSRDLFSFRTPFSIIEIAFLFSIETVFGNVCCRSVSNSVY